MRKIFVLTGPTCSGKSALARSFSALDPRFDVVNADSKQVYSQLPVLTAQPIANNPGLLYGHVSVFEPSSYSVSRWMSECFAAIQKQWSCRQIPLLVGGTPLYLHCLLNGISVLPDLPKGLLQELTLQCQSLGRRAFFALIKKKYRVLDSFASLDPYRLVRDAAYLISTGKTINALYAESPKLKLECDFIEVLAIVPNRVKLYEKINKRFLQMLDCDVIQEVEHVINNKSFCTKPEIETIHGFREIANYLDGALSLEDMIAKTQKNTRNYAKRQMTWLRNKFDNIKKFDCGSSVLNYVATNLKKHYA